MQRELAAAGHTISINSLTVLLREEGFSRLPRRADDERPPDREAGDPYLVASGLADQPIKMPWFGNKKLISIRLRSHLNHETPHSV
jgi:hypothetical protein